jgi:2',3'-cyclic-nucleotide 2'-phosphodiesterase (5'-nucleotidase family)
LNKSFNRSKKWISVVLTAILLLAMLVPNVSANTAPVSLAKWDFSSTTNKLVATSGTPANLDKTLSVNGGPTISTTYVGGPTTGISVPNASPWTAATTYWAVSLSTKGYENITLSSKQYGSSTGPKDFKVQYSLDNSNWTDVANGVVTVAANWTSGVLANVSLPSDAADKELIYVRWLKSSTVSIGGGAVASGGTNRMGEIEFKATEKQATPNPEPQPDPNAVPGKGTVTLGGAPLANLVFSVKETTTNEWFDFVSNENGEFTHNLANGTYKLAGLWVAPTWYPLDKTFTIKDGLVNGLKSLTLDALDYETSVDNTNVVGYVKNGTQALAHQSFSLHNTTGDWFNAQTDKNGKFALHLSDGSYQIDGIWDSARGKWYELNQQFSVTGGVLVGSELLVDIASVYNENVTGTLSKGTEKLANLTFSIRTSAGQVKWYDVQTDATGKFSLRLPNGSYTVDGIWVGSEGNWYVLNKAFTVNGSAQVNLDVLADSVTPTLTGVLKKDNVVLPNIQFSVRTADQAEVQWYNITTDATGSFTKVLPNGNYVVEGIWLGAENHWYALDQAFTVDGPSQLNINLVGQVASKFNLSIMHTNDTHANVDNGQNKINVAKKQTAINSVRATKPNALLLDAGDVFSGTLYFNEYQGLADLEFMNLAGYDAMTFGNHEFDMGTGVLANFVKDAGFPFLSANVNFAADANLKNRFHDETTSNALDGQIYNGMVKVVDGEKIGIFGLTTAETPTISSPGADVVFENYIAEAQKSVDAFKALGVNKIVALSHLGYNDSLTWDNDLELAKQVEGIDVIVGGHTHVKLDAPVFETTGVEPTVIVQANEYNKFLGTLDVTFDAAGKVITTETTGKLLDVSTYAEDAATLSLLNTKYKPAIQAKESTVVGKSTVQLVGGNPAARTGETNLGNLVADGMLAKAKTINPNTVIALQNGGGVRVTLPAGDITLANVFQVLPFGNALAIMDLKGSEIKEALELGVKTAPATANGAFLQVSGLKFTYDSTKPVGEKVQSVLVKGADGSYTTLDSTKNYFVATNIFTAKGGDGYTMLAKAYAEGRVSEPGFVDWEIFADYIKAQPNQTVSPQVEGRIINVAPQTIPAASFSGTEASPKVYNGNVIVDVTDVAKLEYATVKGNLTLKGNTGVELFNVTVEGDTLFE